MRARKGFELGSLYMTDGINSKISEDLGFMQFVHNAFERYCNGDWGDLDEEDKAMNDRAIAKDDDRILARYEYNGEPIYIITEWDRSATTILFSYEY